MLESSDRDFLFNKTITYFTHELNGTLISNNMSIYQGYFLMTTSRIVDLSKIKPEFLGDTINYRDVAYFTENAVSSLPVAYKPFSEFLYSNLDSQYKDFLVYIVSVLLSIVIMILLMVIITIIILLSIRRMFKDVYNSFLNISEGEYDERIFQLNVINDSLNRFKKHYYYNDFMGINLNENLKPNTNKPAKKRVNNKYCFELMMSVFLISIFYII